MYPSYYVICLQGYEIDGKAFYTGQIQWKPRGERPILNPNWRKATDKEIGGWLKKTGELDYRNNLEQTNEKHT